MLSLSSREMDRLVRVQEVLLRPLDHPHLDDWRRAVNLTLKDLLGADRAAFMLPSASAGLYYTEDADPSVAAQYAGRIGPFYDRLDLRRREIELVVMDRKRFWGDFLDEFYRTEYYNDYLAANRFYDSLAISIPVDRPANGHAIPGGAERPVSTLFFHHERPTGPKFGERGYRLAWLLVPAFRAGVRTYLDVEDARGALGRAVDALQEGVELWEPEGSRRLHRNASLARTLQADPESDRLTDAIGAIVRALGRPAGTSVEEPAGRPARELRTGAAAYRIQGCYIGPGPLANRRLVLVSVTRLDRDLPPASDLRERHGLTAREAEVALRLARRRSNREIAAELDISPHTARHHTERVLRKLGVDSRRAVADALTRAEEASG